MDKRKRSYIPPEPNAQAVCQMRAWLSAVDIPHRQANNKTHDIIIAKPDGSDLPVKVVMEPSEAPVDGLAVVARALTQRKLNSALAAFHDVTRHAGYGTPIPVDRGIAPEHKLSYKDNLEAVSMRHREFRRVPNPTNEHLLHYKTVMTNTARNFLRSNHVLCEDNMLEFEDLMTYANVWTCNYIGLYEVPNPTNNDNEKKLHVHLMQRFNEFRSMLKKKGRNVFAHGDDYSIATKGRPIDWNADKDGVEDSEEPEVDEDYKDRHTEIETKSYHKRRASASKALDKALNDLDHDTMVSTLALAGTNIYLDIIAREEARRRLQAHNEACSVCKAEEPAQLPHNTTLHRPRNTPIPGNINDTSNKPCPLCRVTCTLEETEAVFGFRTMKYINAQDVEVATKRRQSYCRKCRNLPKPKP